MGKKTGGGGRRIMAAKVMSPGTQAWASYLTNDYQGRRPSGYPKANQADTITLERGRVVVGFKNTDEDSARNWTEEYMERRRLPGFIDRVVQSGDYADDMVDVIIRPD